MERKREKVLGFDVDIITFDDAIKFLVSRIQEKIGTHVVTINPEIIETAISNKDLSNILHRAELVVPDGIGIKLALKLKRINQERIPGIDLACELLEHANSLEFTVALIGAKQDVLEKAKNAIKNNLSDIKICYARNGYFSKDKENEIINDLKLISPNIVLVAMGSPKQEFFIKKCKQEIPTATYIGIGGSFDVWAGVVERAPEFFRIMGCEWIYRTYKQPQRLKRIYKTLPLFAINAIIDAIKDRYFSKGKKNG